MNKRRRLVLIGLGGVALAAGLAVGIGPVIGEAELAAQVRRRLSFLKLDEAGLNAFAKDQVAVLLAKRPTWNRMKYHFMSVFSKSFTQWNHSTDKRTRKERMIDTFCETYLLSTDFFRNGADPARIVRYVSLYDPMIPCGNPFARPVVVAGGAT